MRNRAVVDIGFQLATEPFDDAYRKIGFAIAIQPPVLVVGVPLGFDKGPDKVMDVIGHF